METVYSFGIVVMALILLIGTIVPKSLKSLHKVIVLLLLLGLIILAALFKKNGF